VSVDVCCPAMSARTASPLSFPPMCGGVSRCSSQDGAVLSNTRACALIPPEGGGINMESSSRDGAVIASRSQSESVIHDIFFGAHQSGIRANVFTYDHALLREQCSLHGLVCLRSFDVCSLRQSLLNHIVSGGCALDRGGLQSNVNHVNDSECKHLRAGFLSADDLSVYIIDVLLSAPEHLTTRPRTTRLRTIRPTIQL